MLAQTLKKYASHMATSAGWVVHRSIPPVMRVFLSYAMAACVPSKMVMAASGGLGVVFNLELVLGQVINPCWKAVARRFFGNEPQQNIPL